jgi:1-phosphatidylinositol-3-phosphate 5-kinase
VGVSFLLAREQCLSSGANHIVVLLRFSEFPSPGDVKKHLLPVLIDEELAAAPKAEVVKKEEAAADKQNKFWMPDRFCKVCYGCEEAFTMYRRRHHCRMCGQIFCNSCSSFYIDGKMFNTPGLVRACRLCYEQQGERGDAEHKHGRPKALPVSEHTLNEEHTTAIRPAHTTIPPATWVPGGHIKLQEAPEEALARSSNLQNRYMALRSISYHV